MKDKDTGLLKTLGSMFTKGNTIKGLYGKSSSKSLTSNTSSPTVSFSKSQEIQKLDQEESPANSEPASVSTTQQTIQKLEVEPAAPVKKPEVPKIPELVSTIDIETKYFEENRIPAEELEPFCLKSVLSLLPLTPIYKQNLTEIEAERLGCIVAFKVFDSVQSSLPPVTPTRPTYDLNIIKIYIKDRIESTIEQVLKKKRHYLRKPELYINRAGFYSHRGKRENNEDKFSSFPFLNEITNRWREPQNVSFFGIFDGHGGIDCSTFVSNHLFATFGKQLTLSKNNIRQALYDSFQQTNKKWVSLMEKRHFSNICGSTGVVAVIEGKNLYISWVGDSSAILFLKENVWLDFVLPHKPSYEQEKKRICRKGGYIENDRVNGVLAVSRSFGDCKYGCVDAEPDIMEYTLTGNELFLVLCCDGITDVLDAPAIELIVQEQLKKPDMHPNQIAKAIVDEALKKGSNDNCTVIFIPFNPEAFNQVEIKLLTDLSKESLNDQEETDPLELKNIKSDSLNSKTSDEEDDTTKTFTKDLLSPADEQTLTKKLEIVVPNSTPAIQTPKLVNEQQQQQQDSFGNRRQSMKSGVNKTTQMAKEWNDPNLYVLSELSALTVLTNMIKSASSSFPKEEENKNALSESAVSETAKDSGGNESFSIDDYF